jgi:hypothetical protein
MVTPLEIAARPRTAARRELANAGDQTPSGALRGSVGRRSDQGRAFGVGMAATRRRCRCRTGDDGGGGLAAAHRRGAGRALHAGALAGTGIAAAAALLLVVASVPGLRHRLRMVAGLGRSAHAMAPRHGRVVLRGPLGAVMARMRGRRCLGNALRGRRRRRVTGMAGDAARHRRRRATEGEREAEQETQGDADHGGIVARSRSRCDRLAFN